MDEKEKADQYLNMSSMNILYDIEPLYKYLYK